MFRWQVHARQKKPPLITAAKDPRRPALASMRQSDVGRVQFAGLFDLERGTE
jgi:hypothetical protein